MSDNGQKNGTPIQRKSSAKLRKSVGTNPKATERKDLKDVLYAPLIRMIERNRLVSVVALVALIFFAVWMSLPDSIKERIINKTFVPETPHAEQAAPVQTREQPPDNGAAVSSPPLKKTVGATSFGDASNHPTQLRITDGRVIRLLNEADSFLTAQPRNFVPESLQRYQQVLGSLTRHEMERLDRNQLAAARNELDNQRPENAVQIYHSLFAPFLHNRQPQNSLNN